MVALERMIQDEKERAIALDAMADEIRARMCTPYADYVDPEGAFAAARARIGVTREG
jgi:antitoxin ParD1/3/4